MNLLYIDQTFSGTNIGGAFKSSYAIINELIKYPDFNIAVLATNTKKIKFRNFSAKPIRPILKTPSKKINKLIKYLRVNQYFSFFPILWEIYNFKPDVIMVQRDLSFSTILAGFFCKTPVINIVRDAMGFCPKQIDIKGYKNCNSILSRSECWECINRWRTLKKIFEDKPNGFNGTFRSNFSTLYYKIQYIFIKLNLYLLRFAYLNIVASPSMKNLIEKRTKNVKVLIRKIAPVTSFNIKITSEGLAEDLIKKIENSNKNILFVIPRNEKGSKGYPFIKKLLIKLPKNYVLIVVGTLISELNHYPNVINIGQVPIKKLYYLYRKSQLTIVPSIYTEAFGRVVLESIINGTPVIVSPQTSASYLFKNKAYVKILPLNTNLWLKEIQNFINNPIAIPIEDRRKIEQNFSAKESAKEIVTLIKIIN